MATDGDNPVPSGMTGEYLLDALTSGALLVNRAGAVQYVNPAFCEVSGLSAKKLFGRSLSDLFNLPPDADCALCLGTGEQWATFHSAFLSVSREGGNSEALRFKVKHSPLPDDGVLCLLDPFSEDATLTQAHSDFVSTVSHEFRTPLTSIKGFADTLLQYGAQLPDEEKRRFLNIIKDQADRLTRLVENLLTVSKLGASRVELSYRPINLQSMLEKVIHSVQAKLYAKNASAPERRFELVLNPSVLEVWADADRLEQVLLNLVDNAAKYSPAGSTVHLRGEYLPGDDTRIRITVRDEGPGIPSELLPRIFTKFYRAETPLQQEVEGTGLGLYISKSLTTAMGGEISADSKPGEGSTFTVILPAATPERQAIHRRRLSAEETAHS